MLLPHLPSLISLGVGTILAIILFIRTLTEFELRVPPAFFLYDHDLAQYVLKTRRRSFNTKITLGVIATIFVILAVILLFI